MVIDLVSSHMLDAYRRARQGSSRRSRRASARSRVDAAVIIEGDIGTTGAASEPAVEEMLIRTLGKVGWTCTWSSVIIPLSLSKSADIVGTTGKESK